MKHLALNVFLYWNLFQILREKKEEKCDVFIQTNVCGNVDIKYRYQTDRRRVLIDRLFDDWDGYIPSPLTTVDQLEGSFPASLRSRLLSDSWRLVILDRNIPEMRQGILQNKSCTKDQWMKTVSFSVSRCQFETVDSHRLVFSLRMCLFS